jgi:hypothetical protein
MGAIPIDEYLVKLKSLKVDQLKNMVRNYLHHLNIKLTGVTKNYLLFHLIKHTELIDNKIYVKSRSVGIFKNIYNNKPDKNVKEKPISEMTNEEILYNMEKKRKAAVKKAKAEKAKTEKAKKTNIDDELTPVEAEVIRRVTSVAKIERKEKPNKLIPLEVKIKTRKTKKETPIILTPLKSETVKRTVGKATIEKENKLPKIKKEKVYSVTYKQKIPKENYAKHKINAKYWKRIFGQNYRDKQDYWYQNYPDNWEDEFANHMRKKREKERERAARMGGGRNKKNRTTAEDFYYMYDDNLNEDEFKYDGFTHEQSKQINDTFDIDINVPPDPNDLKKKYRELIRLHHPDKNPNDIEAATEMAKLINNAYAAIKKHFGFD